MSAATHRGMNVSYDQLASNILANTSAGHQQVVKGSALADAEYMLLAGGPSLNDHVDEIRERSRDLPVVCVNGAYTWALDKGIHPTAMVMVDAQPECVRFVPATSLTCQYFLASQVHPAVYAKVPSHQRWMWHNDASPEVALLLNSIYGRGKWLPIKGGPTVTLRALWLFKLMGWVNVSVYGLDGNLADAPDGPAHAYPQRLEGDVLTVKLRGRAFRTTAWMLAQAQDFVTQMDAMPEVTVTLHGDNLMTHLLKHSPRPPENVLAAP